MIEHLASSDFGLIFCIGISAYIGVLHFWFWRRGQGETLHAWVAAWCLSSLAFQLGRYAQLQTADPEVAVRAARLVAASAPLMIFCLVRFARALNRRPASPWFGPGFLAANALLAGLVLLTPLFVSGETVPRLGWFGREYIAAPGTAILGLFVPYALLAFLYVAREIRAASHLEAGERRVLAGCIVVYLAMGLVSILSSMRVLSIPMLAEYSPLVIALGLNYLLVHRHRRLQTELEQLVEESEARYRRLVENAPLGVIACDSGGEIVAVNPYMLELLGSPSARRTRQINLLAFPPLIEAGISDVFRCCMSQGQPTSAEVTYTSLWGRSSDYRLHVAPVRDADGYVAGAQAIVEDIGDRRRLELELRQSKRLEAVGRLAAGIAHEINNPMAYVRSNLALLHDDWEAVRAYVSRAGLPDELGELFRECQDLIDESREGVDRIVAIVRDFREFSRVGGEERAPADLNEIVEEALRTADPYLHPGITVERDLGEIPPIVGSADQLRQVVLNLVVNAVQAVGAAGHVWIRTRRAEDRVVMRVEDDGPGVPPEIRERLFEPFFTTKPSGEGTGLGLYICYEIVCGHGGALRLEPRPGAGAAFEVQLAAGDAKPEPEAD